MKVKAEAVTHQCTKTTSKQLDKLTPSFLYLPTLLRGLLVIILLFSFYSAFGVNRHAQMADELFYRFNFSRALEFYHKSIKHEPPTFQVAKRIGDCYRLLHNPGKAIEWYRKALTLPGFEPETYLHLSQLLRSLEQYDESAIYLKKFYALTGSDSLMLFRGLTPGEYLESIKSLEGRVEVVPIDLNTSYSELGPAIWNYQLVFMSNRPKNSVSRRQDIRDKGGFFDLYSARIINLTEHERPRLFDRNLNSPLNDGPVSFSANGRQVYFTRNTPSRRGAGSELNVLMSNLEGSRWSKHHLTLPFRVRGNSVAHPATMPDDSGIFFASDMPGGFGGMDIYFSARRNGFLSKPENLGPQVNTPGNEIFPYIDSKGRLFFASDGHPGLGGLDIFIALPVHEGYSAPVNLGSDFNSISDDFSIALNEDGKSGYFASNREAGNKRTMGSDDIYAFKLLAPLEFTVVHGMVRDGTTGLPGEGIVIRISKSDGMRVSNLTTGSNGRFMIPILNDASHLFEFIMDNKPVTSKKITPLMMAGEPIMNFDIDLNKQ